MWIAQLLLMAIFAWAPFVAHANAEEGGEDASLYDEVNENDLGSLVYTHWEWLEIRNAIASIGKEIVPDSQFFPAETKQKPPAGDRYIHLEGILYTSENDWIVWLNGKQIRPNALPAEALGFKVFKDYVELKWFDDYTNQVIPLRIRPFQKFNIDTRLFLPG